MTAWTPIGETLAVAGLMAVAFAALLLGWGLS